jgi:nucleotide-binding universal stress UspA family protein
MKQDQMVMERPAQRSIEQEVRGSAIRTMIFHVHADETLDVRLEAALSIARSFGAHLKLVHVTPIDAYTVVDAFGVFTNLEIVAELEADAAKLRARLEARLGDQDVEWRYEEVTGSLMPRLAQCAALADLLVIGRESKSPEFEGRVINLLGELLYHARTPLLVLGDKVVGLKPTGPAIVAWNGSHEAANALRASVPLLKMLPHVVLLTVEEPKGVKIPATQARDYLSRHAIDSRVESCPQMGESIADDILAAAYTEGASCIVMGGYGHSRAGEILFGGVTRTLLKGCALPLFISR